MISLLARKNQFIISSADGTNPIDITSIIEECTITDDHLSQSGLIKATGKLTLTAYPDPPFSQSLNPRINRGLFKRGNRLDIWVSDSNGTLRKHPRGALRLLKIPAPAHPENPKLEIAIGCELELFNYKSASDTVRGGEVGVARNRTEIIKKLAIKGGFASCIPDTFSITGYPIEFDYTKFEGSYIDAVGEVAFAAGYVVWIDSDRQMRSARIDLNNPPVSASYVVGKDESIFIPIQGEETSVDTVRAVGTSQKIVDNDDPKPEVAVTKSSNFSLFGFGSREPNIITEISRTYYQNLASSSPTISRFVERSFCLVFREAGSFNTGLIPALIEENGSRYQGSFALPETEETEEEEPSEGGEEEEESGDYLLRQWTQTSEPIGVTQKEVFPQDTRMAASKRTDTYYKYLNEITIEIVENTSEQAAIVYPTQFVGSFDFEARSQLVLSSQTIQRWKKQGKGWILVEVESNFATGENTSKTTHTDSGKNQPPAP